MSTRKLSPDWLRKARTEAGSYDLTRLPGDLAVQIEPGSEEAMTLRPVLRAAGVLSGEVARLMAGEAVRLDALLASELVAHHLRTERRLAEWLAGVEAQVPTDVPSGEEALRRMGWTGPIIRPDGASVPAIEASGSGTREVDDDEVLDDEVDAGDDDEAGDDEGLPWPEDWADDEVDVVDQVRSAFFGTVAGPFAEYDEQGRPLMEVYTATTRRGRDNKRRVVGDVLVGLERADAGRAALVGRLEPGRYVLILRRGNGTICASKAFAFGAGRPAGRAAAGEAPRPSLSTTAMRMARESDQAEIDRLTKALERAETRADKLVEQLDALREKRHEERMAYIAKMSEGVTQDDLVEAVVEALEDRMGDEPQSVISEARDLIMGLSSMNGGGRGGLFGGG